MTYSNTSRKLQPKVAAVGAAGAATVVLVWALGFIGVEVPGEVASAFTTLLATAAGYLRSE